jgi:hypothetical protein
MMKMGYGVSVLLLIKTFFISPSVNGHHFCPVRYTLRNKRFLKKPWEGFFIQKPLKVFPEIPQL